MAHYRHLIVGGGLAGDAAARGILEESPDATVGLISAEAHPPYNRPLLSKGLWKGEAFEKVWRNTPADKIDLLLSRTATSVDAAKHRVRDHTGATHSYDTLLLATGGATRRLSFPDEGIVYFRTLDDYRALRELAGKGERFALIGGGFIGSEVAAALRMNGKQVTMIFPEASIGSRVYPARLAEFLDGYYRSKGVEVLSNESIAGIERDGPRWRLRLGSGREMEFDGVVAGIGIRPNVELARDAGLEVGDGILVNEFLRTSDPDIYAAGDAANFFNPALGRRIRVEHEDNAEQMGRRAGLNMTGRSEPWRHLPFFYSDLFDLGYEAVGELDSRHETIQDWKEEFREGVVYYLERGRVRGVLLWNVWGQVDSARELIAEKGPFTAGDVKGRLPRS